LYTSTADGAACAKSLEVTRPGETNSETASAAAQSVDDAAIRAAKKRQAAKIQPLK